MKRVILLIACVCFEYFVGGNSINAQSIIRGSNNPNYHISVNKISTLSPLLSDDHLIEAPIVAYSKGYYYVGETYNHRIVVIDSMGSVAAYVGSVGSGPGELLSVSTILPTNNDILYVFDDNNGRISRYHGNGTYIGSVRFVQRVIDAIFTYDNKLVVCAYVAGPSSYDRPFHYINSEGDIELSFGNDNPIRSRPFDMSFLKWIAPTDDGNVWVAYFNKPHIEKWTTNGNLINSVDIDLSWFETWDTRNIVNPFLKRPYYQVSDIYEVSPDIVCLIIQGPAIHWKPNPSMDHYNVSDMKTQYDTAFVLVNVASKEVLAESRLPGLINKLAAPGLACEYDLIDDNTAIHIYRIEIVP